MTAAVEEHSSLVLRGLSSRDCRRRATCLFDERYGTGCWKLCGEESKPCLVSIGGRVRLVECRFEAEREQ
jgi:hypothetical protein